MLRSFSLEYQRAIAEPGRGAHRTGRALDILITLISNTDEVISKRDLMAKVWPVVTVDVVFGFTSHPCARPLAMAKVAHGALLPSRAGATALSHLSLQ
jgi:hypothetical protein